MKILITAHSNMGLGGFRQKVVETDKKNVREYFHSMPTQDVLSILNYPESRTPIRSMSTGMTTNRIPNFIKIEAYDITIILDDSEKTRIDLILQDQVDIIEGTRQ